MTIVPFVMRSRSDPWKWPACIGLTVVLFLATVFLVPESWIDAFFSPLSLVERLEREQVTQWTVILPPPVVEEVPDHQLPAETPRGPQRRTTEHLDPDWWTRGWIVKAFPLNTDPDLRRTTAAADSVAILLTALGVERDFLRRTRPDSLLASRLFLLQVEDSFKFDELKPYLSAMARSRDYADILSRAADMYDHFLAQEIMTPD